MEVDVSPVTIGFRDVIDWHVLRDMLRYSDWQPPPGIDPTFIMDLGAYGGYSTFCLALAYPDSTVVAVEADGANYDLLAQNMRDIPHVISIKAAVWGYDGQVAFGGLIPNMRSAWEGEGCEARRLGTLIDQSFGPTHVVDYVKMDIEGAEHQVLDDGADWCERVRLLRVEVHPTEQWGTADAQGALEQWGYQTRLVYREHERGEDTVIAWR